MQTVCLAARLRQVGQTRLSSTGALSPAVNTGQVTTSPSQTASEVWSSQESVAIANNPKKKNNTPSKRVEEGVFWRTNNAIAAKASSSSTTATTTSSTTNLSSQEASIKGVILGGGGGGSSITHLGVGSQWTGGVVGSLQTINQLSPRSNQRRFDAELSVMTSFQDATGDNASGQRWKKNMWATSGNVTAKSERAAYCGSGDINLHLHDLEESNLMLGLSGSEPRERLDAATGKRDVSTKSVKIEGVQKKGLVRTDAMLLWQLRIAKGGHPSSGEEEGSAPSSTASLPSSSPSSWGVVGTSSPLLKDTLPLAQRQDFFLYQLSTKYPVLFDSKVVSASTVAVKSSLFDSVSLDGLATYMRLFRQVNLTLDLEALPNPPANNADLPTTIPATQPRDRHALWLRDLYGNHALQRGFLSVEKELVQIKSLSGVTRKRKVHTASTHIADIIASLAVCGTSTTQRVLSEESLYTPTLANLLQVGGVELNQRVQEDLCEIDTAHPSTTLSSTSNATRAALVDVKKQVIEAMMASA